jgi:hypothetical protein
MCSNPAETKINRKCPDNQIFFRMHKSRSPRSMLALKWLLRKLHLNFSAYIWLDTIKATQIHDKTLPKSCLHLLVFPSINRRSTSSE